MHPVIRLIVLILMSLIVSRDTVPTLITGLSLILGFYVMTSLDYLSDAKQMLLKLRWFFVSITILYFWFTPGEGLFGIHSGWIPTKEGISFGLSRVISLVLIVLAVNLFLKTTHRKDLISALIWLTRPLNVLGFSSQRFAIRMTLTLEAVTNVQSLFPDKRHNKKLIKQPVADVVANISQLVATVFQQVIKKAEDAKCELIEIPQPVAPPLYQWAYLPIIAIIFWSANLLSIQSG